MSSGICVLKIETLVYDFFDTPSNSRPSSNLGMAFRVFFPNSSPFSSDGMPVGVGPDGMAPPPLPPGIAAPVPEAPPAPPASECNDLEFTLENVDQVGDRATGEVFLYGRFGTEGIS